MNIKRILTTVIGLPIVIFIIALNKLILINILISLVALRAIYEITNCAKNKNHKIISWIGYIYAILIAFINIIPMQIEYIIYSIIVTMLILFFHVIVTNGKITFEDISYTLFSLIYIIGLIVFIPLIYWLKNGNILIWYVFISAWGTDTFAYIIGKHFGKHKFSKISPYKTIEGCVAGTLGSIILTIIYTIVMNNIFNMQINYVLIGIMGLILSLVGQIGDFAASVIKRHFEVKDFSNLFPGHGGMVDRIDSVICIAPFVYLFVTMLL